MATARSISTPSPPSHIHTGDVHDDSSGRANDVPLVATGSNKPVDAVAGTTTTNFETVFICAVVESEIARRLPVRECGYWGE